jgi:GT2 family glycosyltransferase
VTPINLALTAGRQDVEHVILDVGKDPSTRDWLTSLSPRLRIVARSIEPLHFAQAYNAVSRYATGDVFAWLDGDNVIGPDYVTRVLAEITADPLAIVHCWTGDWLDGTCGRLAMHRDLFSRIGGYDEALGTAGSQDLDLRDRAQAAGGHVVVIQDPSVVGLAIRTSHAAKTQHLRNDYYQTTAANAALSRANIAAGRLVANLKDLA